jgi:hypothetical protein
MRDTPLKTLDTPRLFANAIRRARRLASRSNKDTELVPANLHSLDGINLPHKHSYENSRDIDDHPSKRFCDSTCFQHPVSMSSLIQGPVDSATSNSNCTANSEIVTLDLASCRANLAVQCVYPLAPADTSDQSESEYLRLLAAIFVPPPALLHLPATTQPGTPAEFPQQARLSSAFLQGAAWAAAMSPLLPPPTMHAPPPRTIQPSHCTSHLFACGWPVAPARPSKAAAAAIPLPPADLSRQFAALAAAAAAVAAEPAPVHTRAPYH